VKALAKQKISNGIRVNGVAPGPFWTPLQVSGGDSQTKLVAVGSETPVGRPGQPAELASILRTPRLGRRELYHRANLWRHGRHWKSVAWRGYIVQRPGKVPGTQTCRSSQYVIISTPRPFSHLAPDANRIYSTTGCALNIMLLSSLLSGIG